MKEKSIEMQMSKKETVIQITKLVFAITLIIELAIIIFQNSNKCI